MEIKTIKKLHHRDAWFESAEAGVGQQMEVQDDEQSKINPAFRFVRGHLVKGGEYRVFAGVQFEEDK